MIFQRTSLLPLLAATALAQAPISRVEPIVAPTPLPVLAPRMAPPAPAPTAVPIHRPAAPAPAPEPAPVAPVAPPPVPAVDFKPSWETQKNARNFLFGIPAPRGQIVDRKGRPLAQTRVAYNLAIQFPAPHNLDDRGVFNFVQEQVTRAQSIVGQSLTLNTDSVLKHYKNRAYLPLVIAQDLSTAQRTAFERMRPRNLLLQPIYLRYYPQGNSAAHIVGYVGRTGRYADGVIDPNETLWPGSEGREGLEQTFEAQLQGKLGQMSLAYDAEGKKASEQIITTPTPGYNVVTSLDIDIQKLCENTLRGSAKRGAMVILDPNNGDILAMASWPSFDPNAFIPAISGDEFKILSEDPDKPLYPRAFRATYPPGSTYKVFSGLAAMQSGKIDPLDEFSCPASIRIEKRSFPNWKRGDAGYLNFADALTQSCNTWFYQIGMKTGWRTMGEYASRLGLGMRTGIPLAYEGEGRVPDNDFMMKQHNRRIGNGDEANIAVGQGDVLVTPLQLAQAMGAVGNGGTLYKSRLVTQVQTIDSRVVIAYEQRVRGQMDIDPEVMKQVRIGMQQVVTSRSGTAPKAAVPGVKIAGKTGTAQWGAGRNERVAAWFAGFIPAEKPKYAFAVVYEGEKQDDDVHGGSHSAPMIGKVMRELFKDEAKKPKKKKKDEDDPDADEEMQDEEEEDLPASRRRTPREDPN